MIIGITGGHGSGKSSVAKLLGYEVIDVDRILQILLVDTESLKSELVKAFGTCDRKELEKIVFTDSYKMDEYILITAKYVKPVVKILLAKKSNAIIDALFLFESGLDKFCKFTIAVLANRGLRKPRIMERDGLNRKEAEMRIDTNKPDEYYLKKTPFSIDNNGEDLTVTAPILIDKIARFVNFRNKCGKVLDALVVISGIIGILTTIDFATEGIILSVVPGYVKLIGVGVVVVSIIAREKYEHYIYKKAKNILE